MTAAGLAGIRPVADVPDAFAGALAGAFAARPGERFSLVLSGGPTARACYERVAARHRDDVDWSLVDVYMGDERFVPPDDPDANQRLVRESLLDRVGPVGSFRPMPTTGTMPDCVAAYQHTIAGLVARGGPDLVHLGLGPDGHTASLFPGSSALAAGPDELVVATKDPNDRNPHPRLSLTLPAIASARLAVFTVSGESKREAFGAVRSGADLPAARVRAGDVRWLVDEAAFGPADTTTSAGAPR